MKENDRWIKRWKVPGSNGDTWTVAQDKTGAYGCSCPVWKFRRQECHHIVAIKRNPPNPEAPPAPPPECVLANVERPQLKDNRLLIPLVAIGNTQQEATICNFLLEHGWSMGRVREQRHVPHQWTACAIRAYVAQYGEAAFVHTGDTP